jgi:hypothetical protein
LFAKCFGKNIFKIITSVPAVAQCEIDGKVKYCCRSNVYLIQCCRVMYICT